MNGRCRLRTPTARHNRAPGLVEPELVRTLWQGATMVHLARQLGQQVCLARFATEEWRLILLVLGLITRQPILGSFVYDAFYIMVGRSLAKLWPSAYSWLLAKQKGLMLVTTPDQAAIESSWIQYVWADLGQ